MTLPDRTAGQTETRARSGRGTTFGRDVASALPFFMRANGRAALLVFLIVLSTGAAIGLMLPRRFVASTDLWLDRGRSAGDAVAPDSQAARLARNTELRLLNSRDLSARTVRALGLDRVVGLGQPRDGSLLNARDAQSQAVRAVQERLSVDAIGQTYAVRVRFRADNPSTAASVANRLADLYVDDRQGSTARARRSRRRSAIIADTRDAMLQSEAAVAGYRSAALLIRDDGKQNGLQSDLAALDAELAAVRTNAEASRARAANATLRLRDLERNRTQRAIEDGTVSEAIGGQVAIQRLRLDQIASQANVAEARVGLLSRMRERAGRAATRGKRFAAELVRLEGIATAARTRHAQANAALGLEAASEARRRSTAYVISHASPQSARREPSPWLVALTVLAGAAAASALAALALEHRHKGFRTSAALEHALGMNVLAMIPDLPGLHRAGADEDRLAVPDYLGQERDSPFAKAFRKLLFALRGASVRKGPMVISVSSALPDEGKTTVALCLTRSAALNGERVVLIDCDVRRPAASRALFETLPVGLVEVVQHGAELSAALKRDPGSQAMVLGVGTNLHDRTISLNPEVIGSLIERLKQDFDVIICDTPPALALSEARETAALADAVLLVVRHRETPKGAVVIARDLLTRSGARIAGAVLTMVRA